MTRTFILLAPLFLAAPAWAGAANGTLKCADAKKAMTVEGEIPGDLTEFTLTVSAGGKSDKKGGPIFRLYALPNTVKSKKGAHRALDATFKAVLEGSDPASPNGWLQGTPLSCTYSYSI
jgi:hypothetical protein